MYATVFGVLNNGLLMAISIADEKRRHLYCYPLDALVDSRCNLDLASFPDEEACSPIVD